MGEAFSPHDPVLLTEVLDALAPRPMPGRAVEPKKSATFSDRALADACVVDGTFGAGGYSRALLDAGARVVGIDRDPSVAPFVAALSEDYPQRFGFVAGRFAELDELAGDGPVDGVVLDIGVSSMQLDQSERGFSFMRAGPLDMRMSMEGESAADLVNTLDETALANLIFAYGEERASRRIAKAIVSVRADAPITDTKALADLIEKTIGRRPGGPHPATRTFQALRIAVNREFDELVEGLFAAERLLGKGGRLAVVTFHSLEDRIVKRFFDADKAAGTQNRHMPMAQKSEARWAPVRKPIKAGEAELAKNPRARSATLRSAVRTGTAARAVSVAGLGVPGFRGAAR